MPISDKGSTARDSELCRTSGLHGSGRSCVFLPRDSFVSVKQGIVLFSLYDSQSTRGVKAKFEQYRQKIELTDGQRDRIIGTHTHLRTKLLQPLSYVNKTQLVGSYKKKTMIRPPSDVDVFVVVNEDRDRITPNAVLNRLKRELSNAYPNTTIRQDKPCLVLDFKFCKFELTPAIEDGGWWGGGYYIPQQGGNSWQNVDDPKELEESLAVANRDQNGLLVPLIKMMKACKRHNGFKNIRSFEMEQKAIDELRTINHYRGGIQDLLEIYDWNFRGMSHWSISQMSDTEFLKLCRTHIFGPEFPV